MSRKKNLKKIQKKIQIFLCNKNGKKYPKKYPKKNPEKNPKKKNPKKKSGFFFRIFLDGRSYYLNLYIIHRSLLIAQKLPQYLVCTF